MKKAGRILSLILALILIVSCFSFASALTLKETYPEAGTTSAAIENFDIKLYFDKPLTEEKLGNINDHCFKLVDENGYDLPIIVLYSPKEEGVVMVLFDSGKEVKDKEGKKIVIQGDTEYTLSISSDFVDDNGDELGVNKVLKYRTLNQKRNMAVNMILMAFLYAGIIIFSIRSAKKQATQQNQKQSGSKEKTVNPYKEAKRTGKSVEEIVELDKQNKEKAAKKAEKKKSKEEDDEWEYLEKGHYRVGAPRTVASAGSTYITGRKAAAEKRKAEEEERKLREAQWEKKKKGKGKKK